MFDKAKNQYQCYEWGLVPPEKEWAEKCKSWCDKHKRCNLDIIRYAFCYSLESNDFSFKKKGGEKI